MSKHRYTESSVEIPCVNCICLATCKAQMSFSLIACTSEQYNKMIDDVRYLTNKCRLIYKYITLHHYTTTKGGTALEYDSISEKKIANVLFYYRTGEVPLYK
jgi:hypothetical protein